VAGGGKLLEWYKVLEKVAPRTVDYDANGQIIIPEMLYYHFSRFPGGALLTISNQEPSRESRELQKRAAAAFGLAYTRFQDLKQAEARARQAVIEAALDRIRAEIASMRTVYDLERITPLIWNELIILGVPFIRCGVFIMDEEKQQIETYLSTPEGRGIAAFHMPYTTPGHISQVLRHWHDKKIYITHWNEADFAEFAGTLVKQGAIVSPEQYMNTLPHGGFYLHFIPFLQGMLYVGNVRALQEEEINLVQSVADAFSTAYARYEDFKKLETAKQQVEHTLTSLKDAQTQLIQKEKMASLGELTAGIAHEIQNPLNFINNFSEVNEELLEEMKQSLQSGDVADALSFAADIQQNIQKISHHGKRADAIVKGMLQHSRANTGNKELTDINALAEEYLRLSYHGLRAKDKNFNATIESHFDDNIGRIEVIPQDLGRVLLNLFNNAFYAVHEQMKKLGGGYEPTISVSTHRLDNKVEITVKDNGMGISKSQVDKIFQPFFTTKPAGQGTGLGLSLSYDIINKGHNGELLVESEEGKYTLFAIRLPL
jgi:signal transduction histidine kinase